MYLRRELNKDQFEPALNSEPDDAEIAPSSAEHEQQHDRHRPFQDRAALSGTKRRPIAVIAPLAAPID